MKKDQNVIYCLGNEMHFISIYFYHHRCLLIDKLTNLAKSDNYEFTLMLS